MPDAIAQDLQASRQSLLRDSNFMRIAGAAAISMLGDQFTLVALPWLVLRLTGDTLAMGAVLISMNVPRVLFMLLGGVLVDRYSAKQVLLLSQSFNGLIIGVLAFLAISNEINIAWVYCLAFLTGCASAFNIPSWSSIFAQSVEKGSLARANSISVAMQQTAAIAGPLLSGLLVTALGRDSGGDIRGAGIAFAIDCASFALACLALSGIVANGAVPARATPRQAIAAIAEGIRYFWSDRHLRTVFLYGATIAFFVGGPIQVAMPVLARQLGHGASAYGIFISIFSVGGVIGVALFGLRPSFRIRNTGLTMLGFDFIVGLLFLPMGILPGVLEAGLDLLTISMLIGFLQMMIVTWVQRRVAPEMLGRVMSFIMLLMLGVPLLSTGIAAWILQHIPLPRLFSACGISLILIVIGFALLSAMPRIDDNCPTSADAETEHD